MSAQLNNPMVTGLTRSLDRGARLEAMTARAHDYLVAELRDALLQDPARKVSTPGYGSQQTAAMEVVYDEFAGTDGDALLHDLIRIAAEASQGRPEAQLRAQAWLKTMTERHAAFHEADLVRLLEGNE